MDDPDCVFMETIIGGAKVGTLITLVGKAHPHAEEFRIELRSSNGDIPFHASFRFNDRCVVRSHQKIGTHWGPEESAGGMPLARGCDFIIHLKIHSKGIIMNVNYGRFCTFNHRLKLSSISSVAVFGEAMIIKWNFS